MVMVFKVVLLLGFLWYSHGAYLGKLGELTPCVAPCTDYGVVITTRGNVSRLTLSVYKFKRAKKKMLAPSDVTKLKTNPEFVPLDLDGLFDQKKSISSAMRPLIEAAKKVVPFKYQLSSPLLFSLDEEAESINEEAWFHLLDDVNMFFTNKTIPFLTGPYAVQDSSDAEDGSFRWHAMNFIRGNFLDNNKEKTAVLSFNGKMASEISYEISNVDKSVSFLSTIASEPHSIVSSTYFRKGTLFAWYKYFEFISDPVQKVIQSPCGPPGLKKKFKGKKGIEWIRSTGHLIECRNVIRQKLFNMCNDMNGCAYLKHKVKGKIYGMPNVVNTMTKLGYKELTKDFTPLELDNAIRKRCSGEAPTVPPPTPAATTTMSTTPKPTTPEPTTSAPSTAAPVIITNKPPIITQVPPQIKLPKNPEKPIKFPKKPENPITFPKKPPTPIKFPKINTVKIPRISLKSPRKASAKQHRSKRSSPEKPASITDCVSANFLYLMLTEAYYLAPNETIHVNYDDMSLKPDGSLGELLVRMQLLA